MLALGTTLPDLHCDAYLPDGRIEALSLSMFRGKWLVLVFWPLDFTHATPADLRAHSELAGDFDLSGAVLLGASVDSVHAHQAWVRHGLGALQFPLLGDVARTLCTACGVLRHDGVAAHATLIVNPEGRIVSVAAADLSIGRSARETLRLLHALQSGELAASAWPLATPTLQPRRAAAA